MFKFIQTVGFNELDNKQVMVEVQASDESNFDDLLTTFKGFCIAAGFAAQTVFPEEFAEERATD